MRGGNRKAHTTMSGDELRCFNCGESYTMNMPAPLSIVTAAMKAFADSHEKCKPSAKGAARMDAASPHEWLQGWDTGQSSKTIWHVMMGVGQGPAEIPYDPAYFGRCHRLFERSPEWRARLDEMRAVKRWPPFVDAWGALEALYVEELPSGNAPKLYAAMLACRGGA